MIRTRHLLISVAIALLILVGLLIAVRVFAPNETEFVPLPAAVFSAVDEAMEYAVTVVESSSPEAARAELVSKLKTNTAASASETKEPTPEPVTTEPIQEEEVEVEEEMVVEESTVPSEEEREPVFLMEEEGFVEPE